jgi:hypothetical protein
LLLKTIPAIDAPEQIDCDEGVAKATGAGFTNTVALLVQELELLVIVKVT